MKYKRFNTSGLCFPGKHYMIDPLSRLKEVGHLIDEELYFTIHAPPQTGKTTFLYAMAAKLNAAGKHIALVVSFEQAGYSGIMVEWANTLLINSIYQAAFIQLPGKYRPDDPNEKTSFNIQSYLQGWCRNLPLPLVLFIDEIDALMEEVFISVLRQFRDGYQARPGHFPASVALVGLRDIREYRTEIPESTGNLGTASPFNVKSDSLTLPNFSREEVFQLLAQHSRETGQEFPEEVVEEIFRLSNGQPWLVNALARQIVSKILAYDFSRPISIDLLRAAKQRLVLRRDTHLDSLVDKLKEDRVKRIVQAIINGDPIVHDILTDDIDYLRDQGIVGQADPLQFANPIYAEIIPRIMAYPIQAMIPKDIQGSRFKNDKGSLDMDDILKEFQAFYRRNSAAWLDRYEYKESAHYLLLMAFLQRIVNAGGDIIRDMAVGNRRIDMFVRYGTGAFALELKIKLDRYTIPDGKEKLKEFMGKYGLGKGYLVIFDPSNLEWEKKIFIKEEEYKGRTIVIVGV
ncbi:MAG: AAA family ATPase [bacterium]|nr:AAA family ATPase [bacterium]